LQSGFSGFQFSIDIPVSRDFVKANDLILGGDEPVPAEQQDAKSVPVFWIDFVD